MSLDVNYDALAKLRVAVNTQAGRLAGIGDDFPARQAASSSLFGTLTGAAELAAAIGSVERHVDEELGVVKTRLDGVERALDTVETNVRNAEHGTEGGLPKVAQV
ncbi:hypothetical protein Sme01_16160 [Sphaerisporangium melleum]|uniref:Uncharacterized protein n=1 Tax=Sphaerisporangium melleum TaxID=321316 RepID=A0A917VT12_9ACTN|nr:hypothetical protein [Sphaerisporangium melleum]GGL14863.1 hypothetical protein GCM10007964_66140 [Sphaerisporangium melleum]GII69140.1 hypothetical protein Sme01_16160 [Sphaerisporangium melleum]